MSVEEVGEKGDDGIDGDHEEDSYYTGSCQLFGGRRRERGWDGRTVVVPTV